MEINADKWGEVKALFEAALEQEPAKRQSFLDQSCQDATLRRVLEKLLASHEQAGAFLANRAILIGGPLRVEELTASFQHDDLLASRFKIVRFIAKGGMGEVYEAEDTELREHVAVKTILPDALRQTRALARFKREVHLAKQVTHPNVCRIFDLFRHPHTPESRTASGDVYFVSMELLLGETLTERLQRVGKMTTQEAMPIVIQLAAALGAAHKAGILHRDFKPGNIILGPAEEDEGVRAVVTDFGLAYRTSGGRFSETPITANEPFGTPAYMSPEQIEGRELTAASDIYALGLVMYEMVSGVRPFESEGQVPITQLIKRLKDSPTSPRHFAPELSPAWETVILRCMEYEPGKRFSSAEALAGALLNDCTRIPATMLPLSSTALAAPVEPQIEELAPSNRQSSPAAEQGVPGMLPGDVQSTARQISLAPPVATSATPDSRARRLSERVAWTFAIVTLTSLLAVLGYLGWRDVKFASEAQVVRAFINPPENTEFELTGDTAGPVAVSPDGTKLVFSAGGFLWMRELKEVTSRQLAGTREAIFPFWSPDSGSIGFAANGKLKTLDIVGGRLVTVCDAPFLRGGSWGPDGTILFAPTTLGEILQVKATGGTPLAVTKLDPANHTTHRWPQLLPDGKHFLYFAANHADPHGTNSATYIASLDGKLNRPLLHSFMRAEYASGYLLYVRDRSLIAEVIDAEKLELRGEGHAIAEDVTESEWTWEAVFSASQNGVLAYQSGGHSETELRWYDRQGRKLGTLGRGSYLSPRLSPDGSRLAVNFGDPNREVWIFDLRRSLKTRLTFGNIEPHSAPGRGADSIPVWSPDTARIAFSGAGERIGRTSDLFQRQSNGQGRDEPLYLSDSAKIPTDWSPDGNFLLFDNDYIGHSQVFVLPLTGERRPYPLASSAFPERSGHFSPDGHWVAYVSRESGSDEVYVATFPGPGGKWRVSNAGGSQPRWRGDSRELFFVSPDNTTLMSAEVEATQRKFAVKSLRRLFRVSFANEFAERGGSYDVAADGSRFLVNANTDETIPPITLVLNWPAAIRKK